MKTKRKVICLAISILLCTSLFACQGGSSQNADLSELQAKIEQLEEENKKLIQENEELLNGDQEISTSPEPSAEEQDVTVTLTGKSSSTNSYGQMFADFVFSVTNNTDKPIKGVQGAATFRDIFDVDIITIACDFTGQTIDAYSTITVDDLSLNCNKFIDNQLKLYNTEYDDLHFEYKITTIVFSDGTTKTFS